MHRRSAPPHSDDVRTALDCFRRIHRVLRESAAQTERRTGISAAQLFVLHALSAGEPLSVNELAARAHTHQSTVSVVADRLVRRRLVARRRSAADRRRAEVTLTARGRSLLRGAPAAPQARLVAGVRALPASRRRRLAAELVALLWAMGIEREPASMLFEEDGRRRPRRNARAQ
jgi:DNA-binding MarR family transcriptional regulator